MWPELGALHQPRLDVGAPPPQPAGVLDKAQNLRLRKVPYLIATLQAESPFESVQSEYNENQKHLALHDRIIRNYLSIMEPRARAAKNVGKMNFSHNELAQLLYAHGDVRNPLPETIRVLDEIVTEFIQGMAFEATRAANYAGRQKVKYEDFEFAFRKNDAFLGKVQEVFEKKGEIESAKKIFTKDDEAVLMKDAADQEHGKKDKAANGTGEASSAADAAVKQEEELGEADDDADAESEVAGRPSKRVRLDGDGK
ncbi:transcription initiation factor IID [Colletotrichum lupini]|uniref:Transcription initiation factor TFIID subunit 13 n=10 Tax=Colletotrichum acutatum species complex TaxID=2707335 RepID=A0A9Q8SBL6_9PEZI|nr:transcription initiation factor IID [Colletotrichum lupini]UQC74389.1 transcription initiation factor IID [Colletotrichum lupini]